MFARFRYGFTAILLIASAMVPVAAREFRALSSFPPNLAFSKEIIAVYAENLKKHQTGSYR